MGTGGQCGQEVERTAECVGQREERDDPASFEVQFGLHAEEYVSGQVVYREHDSLAESGRTRSVADDRYAVVIDFRVGDLFGGESPRITAAVAFADLALEAGQRIAVPFVEAMEVGERKGRPDLFYVVRLDRVPIDIPGEQQHRIRVVDDVVHIVRAEVLQDRDDDGAVSDRGDIDDAPARVVAADQRYLVATLQSGLFEKQVQLGDLLGHFKI